MKLIEREDIEELSEEISKELVPSTTTRRSTILVFLVK